MARVETSVQFAKPKVATLSRAVLLYEGGSDLVLATVHRIVDSKSGPVIGAGKPLSAATSRRILRSMTKRKELPAYLSGNVLARGNGSLIWYEPPQARFLSFAASGLRVGAEGAAPGGDVRAGKVPTPGVVFTAGECGWRVFAFKGGDRPTPDTALFRPPYMNSYEDGGICAGNVTLPASAEPGATQAWSDCFFRSKFTHATGGRLTSHKGGVPGLWSALLAASAMAFDEDCMVAANKTLGSLIEAL